MSAPSSTPADRTILGLNAWKQSGKDELAAMLVRDFGFVRIAFADALYEEAANAFGISVERLKALKAAGENTPVAELALINCGDQAFIETMLRVHGVDTDNLIEIERAMAAPRSFRADTLQPWGTEYRRSQNPRYWLDRALDKVAACAPAPVVIMDVRFNNEWDLVEGELGGRMIRIVREKVDRAMREAVARGDKFAVHPSEVEVADRPASLVIKNPEGAPQEMVGQLLAALPPHVLMGQSAPEPERRACQGLR